MKPFEKLTRRGRQKRFRKIAEVALTCYDLDIARLTFIRDFDNTTFRVGTLSKTSQARFLLRIHKPHDPIRHSVAGVRSELMWLGALRRDTDVVVPEPIPNQHGDFITEVKVDGVPESRPCTLMRWLSGRFVTQSRTRLHCIKMGKLLAQLHRHSEQWVQPTTFMRPKWDSESLKKAIDNLRPENHYRRVSQDDFLIFEACGQRVLERLKQLGEGRAVFGVIHHDLHSRNCVFHKGEARPIDFDACGFGYYFYDFLVTLYDFSSCERHAFFDGYSSVRALSAGYASDVETFWVMRWVHEKAKMACASPRPERPSSITVPSELQKYHQGEPFLYE